jgi:modulator of drug activity B
MQENVFLINGHQYWEMSPGKLNRSLVEFAAETLSRKGYAVRTTHIDDGYDVHDEIENMVWADTVFFQFPVYWFSMPWGMKKFIDEVYMLGRGKIFEGDGRTRSDPAARYGTGGLMAGRTYMLSTTWNAPSVAFGGEGQIFEGKSVDDVFYGFHKAQAFVGSEALPSFSCHDVLKNPNIDSDLQRFENHLNQVFRHLPEKETEQADCA